MKTGHALGQARVQRRCVELVVQATVKRARANITVRTVTAEDYRWDSLIANQAVEQERFGDFVTAVNEIILAKRLGEFVEIGVLAVTRLAKPGLNGFTRLPIDRCAIELP